MATFTIKGNPPGSHSNAALPKNELDAELFNIYELLWDSFFSIVEKLEAFVKSLDTSIQFLTSGDDTSSGPFASPAPVIIAVTTGDGVKEPFTDVIDASVEILVDGTAGSTALIDGGAGPVTVAFVEGEFTVTLTAASTGPVVIGIVGPHVSGLDTTDTHTHTFV